MLWIIITTLLFQTVTEAEIETGTVIIEVVGFESSEGQVVVALFSTDEWGFPPNPNQAEINLSGEISNLAVRLEASNIPEGEYVAMAFHDENSNGQIDSDEAMIGFSGTSQEQQGPPVFENMSFNHSGNVSTVRLIVREREEPENRAGGGGPGGGGPGGGGPGGGGGHF